MGRVGRPRRPWQEGEWLPQQEQVPLEGVPVLPSGWEHSFPGKSRVLSSAAVAENRGLVQPQLASGTPLAVRTTSVLSVRVQVGTGPVEAAPA